ncbi:MAG: replication initiator [Lapillicoccus sp.]
MRCERHGTHEGGAAAAAQGGEPCGWGGAVVGRWDGYGCRGGGVGGVCIRPYVKSVTDVVTGVATAVPIPCGSTREFVCLSCAVKARRLRMHQCREGWHRTTDLEDDHMAEIGDDEMGDDEGDEVGHGEGVDDSAKLQVSRPWPRGVGCGRRAAWTVSRICRRCRWWTGPRVARSSTLLAGRRSSRRCS